MTADTASRGWTLHPQLERDTHAAGDLPLSRVLLIDDANYPWLLLVPRRPATVEIVDLPEAERTQLMGEISQASRVLKAITGCDKINVAALGNVVPQLHVHVIARTRSDPAWPKPVWGAVPPKDYSDAARQQLLALLRQELQLTRL
ncbi:MAG: HIT family protein [Alphaproteobacteria bacterium]|nr:HIT family protein [Alphaproteobacteria bacterium]